MEDVTLNASPPQAREVLRFDGFKKNGRAFLRFQKLMMPNRMFYVNGDFSIPYYIKKNEGLFSASFLYRIERVDGDTIQINLFKKGTKLNFKGYLKSKK